jgi:hypothetical protein
MPEISAFPDDSAVEVELLDAAFLPWLQPARNASATQRIAACHLVMPQG